MLDSTRIIMTEHALSRFKQRVTKFKHVSEVDRYLKYNLIPAGRKTLDRLRWSGNRKGRLIAFVDNKSRIFIFRVEGVAKFVFLTCLPYEYNRPRS